MHRYSPSRRPLSAIVTAMALAFAGLGFVFVASPASAATSITVAATPTSIELGESFDTTATVTGASGGVSFVQFNFFGPDAPTCFGPFDQDSSPTTPSSGTETATVTYTPVTAGTYRVVARYISDNQEEDVENDCNSTGTVVTVTEPIDPEKFNVVVTTQVSDASITLGESFTDRATVSSRGPDPTGDVRFRLYGPDDATCTGSPVSDSTATLAKEGSFDTAHSDSFTPTAVGTYRFVASYAGDANSNPETAPCNEPHESVVVTDPNSPDGATVTTQVSEPEISMRSGSATFHDTATVTPPADGPMPTGTIQFRLYGPDDPDCTGDPADEQTPVAMRSGTSQSTSISAIAPVAGTAQSPSFTATEPGTYRWTAEYSGDVNYPPVERPCNDPNENVLVIDPEGELPTDLQLSTQVSDDAITLGESVTDTATLTPPAGGPKPTGNVGFAVYGPDDATCETPIPVGVETIDPNSDTVTSPSFTPTEPGTYRWVGSYHGDDNYSTILARCNEPNETVVVTDEDPGIVDPDPDPDGDGDEDGGDEDSGDEDSGDEDGGDEDGDLPDTGAQGSPFLLALGLGLTGAGYLISWRHRPGRSR